MEAVTPMKAIRMKCLDCCGGSSNEVNLCAAKVCPLYAFRTGKNPYRAKREYTEEQRAEIAERFEKARKAKNEIDNTD